MGDGLNALFGQKKKKEPGYLEVAESPTQQEIETPADAPVDATPTSVPNYPEQYAVSGAKALAKGVDDVRTLLAKCKPRDEVNIRKAYELLFALDKTSADTLNNLEDLIANTAKAIGSPVYITTQGVGKKQRLILPEKAR